MLSSVSGAFHACIPSADITIVSATLIMIHLTRCLSDIDIFRQAAVVPLYAQCVIMDIMDILMSIGLMTKSFSVAVAHTDSVGSMILSLSSSKDYIVDRFGITFLHLQWCSTIDSVILVDGRFGFLSRELNRYLWFISERCDNDRCHDRVIDSRKALLVFHSRYLIVWDLLANIHGFVRDWNDWSHHFVVSRSGWFHCLVTLLWQCRPWGLVSFGGRQMWKDC